MICDRFGVNGASMEPTLTTGGHIYVNKLLMGGRIYTKFDFDSPKMECFRMPGFRKIKVGDVAVFNVPFGLGIKRLINIYLKKTGISLGAIMY